MLKPEELRELSRLNPWKTISSYLLDVGLMVVGFAAAIRYPHPLVYIAAGILIARSQIAFGLLMHDGAHGRLFTNRRLNDFFNQYFVSAPIMIVASTYRHAHLTHHRCPLTPEDPDLSLIGGYPISRTSLSRKLARDLFGLSYLKFLRYFYARKPSRTKSTPSGAVSPRTEIFSILIAQVFIFSVLALIGHPWLYVTLWILPAVTLGQVLLRIRGIAEHAGYLPGPDQAALSRTVAPESWQTFFFAPHQANYHIEHHLYVSVPYYRLKKLHHLLRERGDLPEARIYRGYLPILRELVK